MNEEFFIYVSSFPQPSPSIAGEKENKNLQTNSFVFGLCKFSFVFLIKELLIFKCDPTLIGVKKIHNPPAEKRRVTRLAELVGRLNFVRRQNHRWKEGKRNDVDNRMNVHGRRRSNKEKHKKIIRDEMSMTSLLITTLISTRSLLYTVHQLFTFTTQLKLSQKLKKLRRKTGGVLSKVFFCCAFPVFLN